MLWLAEGSLPELVSPSAKDKSPSLELNTGDTNPPGERSKGIGLALSFRPLQPVPRYGFHVAEQFATNTLFGTKEAPP